MEQKYSMKQNIPALDQELSRLEMEYYRRDSGKGVDDRYSLFNAAALLHTQSLERHLLALLKKHHVTQLAGKKILDVGCGSGSSLLRFLGYGAKPENLYGIDLLHHRIEEAQSRHPSIHWSVGSAHQLPYTDASFNLVTSFVVFSSILDESLRKQIAGEMWRVLKPGGLILLHDFVYSNPTNASVIGIPLRQIRHLFERPGTTFDFRRMTLAPPISRKVAPHSYWLAFTLEKLKIFNTHTIGVICLK